MAFYEIITRELYSRKKIPAITLRELDPKTYEILKEYAMPEVGTFLREPDLINRKWRVGKYLGNLLLLGTIYGINYGVPMPAGNYLES